MNPLQSRLAVLRRRLRLFLTLRGACWLGAVLLGGALVAGLLDWKIHLPGLVRAILLVLTLSAAVYTAIRYLVGPLSARTDDLTLALKVEEKYPELNDALASTVQFLQQTKASDVNDSPSLRREAVQRALRAAQGCDFNKVVKSHGARFAAATMGVTAALAVTFVLLAPLVSFTALLRLGDPFGDHDWPRQTQIVLDYPPVVGIGQAMVIRGELMGKIPEEAVFEFEGHSPALRNVPVKMKMGDDKSGKLAVALDMSRQRTSFKFRVKANDAVSPARAWHEVKVLPPPRLDLLDGKPSPQVELFFRPYTDLPSPLALAPGKGDVEAFTGTHVRFRAATDKPISRAWIEFRPAKAEVRTAAVLAPLGAANPFQVGALGLGGRQVWDVVPVHIGPTGKVLSVEFLPKVKGDYALHFRDAQGLGNTAVFRLDVTPDPVPVVTMRRPTGSQSVTADAEIALHVTVEDEFFAVRRAYLEYRRKDANGNFLDKQPRRLPLFDHAAMGWALPQLMARLANMPLSIPGMPLRMRPKALDIERRWSIYGLAAEGQSLVIQACAEDFNDVPAFPEPGRSTAIELRIVPRSVLAGQLAEAQAQIQKDLTNLRDKQEDALKKLLEVKQQWEGKGKLRPEDRQKLDQVVQTQKYIQNTLGADKDEGLRLKLDQLQQMIKENKLPSSGDKDRINAIRNEVERIAENHVPKILDQLKNPPPKKDADKGPKEDPAAKKFEGQLAEANKHQAEVSKSLDELLKYLDPWAGKQEITAEAKSILKDQKDLLNETKKLTQQNLTPDEEKAALNAKAALQRRLADRTQRLLDKTIKVADERKEKDPQTAKTLKQAADIDNNQFLPGEMREAEQFIRDKKLNRAINEQTNSVKSLDEFVKALDEKREEDLDRLLKKQKQLQDDLKKIADDMERLQKKSRAAAKLADPKERQRQLKKLADKQKELQEEAQKKVRELARLQAGDAAKAMEEAGEKMARAAKQLDRGDDPEDAQQDALDRLEEAREELDQSRKDTEEELAREQLAKIVDHLKGLKDRQDGLAQDSADLHRRLLQQNHWDKGLKTSLIQYKRSQEELGKETGELKAKLEKSPVFAHILARTVEAMDKASEEMMARHDAQEAVYERRLKAWKKNPQPVRPAPILPSQFRKQMQERNKPQPAPDFPLDQNDQAREKKYNEKTQRLQQDAGKRLARLIDAMKNDKGGIVQRPKPKEDGEKPDGGKKQGDGNAGGRGGGDGIPQIAELKALRSEQADVNDRTKAFSDQHPNLDNLPNDARAELQELQTDQQRVHELFQKVTAAESKGGNP